jgi:hypothetical protein
MLFSQPVSACTAKDRLAKPIAARLGPGADRTLRPA